MHHHFRLAVIAILLISGLVQSTSIAAQDSSTSSLDATVSASVMIGTAAYERSGTRSQIASIGSGTIISPSGLVLTNYHVVNPTEEFAENIAEVEADGFVIDWEEFPVFITDGKKAPVFGYMARKVAGDAKLDLALLQITQDANYRNIDPEAAQLPHVEIGTSKDLLLGDTVHLFGYPGIGMGVLTYSEGVVSGFIYELGFDGVAWISTDATTSAGNSGGGAFNNSGQLVGVPTTASELECRKGDTNLDGTVDSKDNGCRAMGGSLAQFRPIDLAMPLITSVDPTIAQHDPPAAVIAAAPTAAPAAPTAAAAPQPTEVAEAPTAAPAAPTATAVMANADPLIEGQACAERGDWRCAAKYLSLAVEAGNTDVRDQAYDAWLKVADLDLDAGQISAARDAYATATALNPDRPEAAERAAPLADLLAVQSVDGFAGSQVYATGSQGSVSLAYVDGAMTFSFADGSLWSYPIGETPLPSTPIAIVADIRDVSGGASVVIEALSPEASWSFAVDPTNKLVAISSKDAASGALYPWQPAVSFAEVVPGSIQRVEVRLRDRVPTLWINGVDVTAALGITPMAIGPEMSAQFGAMGNPAGGSASVALERISIADIR